MDPSQFTQAVPPARPCPVCGQCYPRTPQFWWRNRATKDGLHHVCKNCGNTVLRSRYRRDVLGNRAAAVAKRRALRLLVLSHYSGGVPCCACCGETLMEFLSIDHINGQGRAERGTLGRYGDSLYRWLKKEGYPKGYRVLCLNCNGALGFYGYCPHERSRLLP